MKKIILIIIFLLSSLVAQCQFERGDIVPERLYTTTYDMPEYTKEYYNPEWPDDPWHHHDPWDPWWDPHHRPDPKPTPIGDLDIGIIILFASLFGAYYLYLYTKDNK